MAKNDDKVLLDGRVVEIQKTYYGVEVSDVPALEGKIIRCRTSGKMKMYKIRIIIGDKVTFELDPYDPQGPLTGRIIFRTK